MHLTRSLTLLLVVFCCAVVRADELVNPSLRAHFTVSVRSLKSFRGAERMSTFGLSRNLWYTPWANLPDVVRPNVPADVATSRTFLRCRPLGWRYGGHTIDVLSMDSVDYEGVVLEGGELLQTIAKGNRLLKTDGNQFVLRGKDSVAALHVPAGFEGTSVEIKRALQGAMQSAESRPTTSAWSVQARLSDLVDPPLWEALQAGLGSTIQPRDHDAESDSAARKEFGQAAVSILSMLVRDAESLELSAKFDDEQQRTEVTFAMEAKPDSILLEEFGILSRLTVSARFPESLGRDFPILGIVRIPPGSLVSECAARLTSRPVSLESRPEDITVSHSVFGLNGLQRQNAAAFAAFCDANSTGLGISGSKFGSALQIPLQPPGRMRVFLPDNKAGPSTTEGFLSALGTSSELVTDGPDPKAGWLLARIRISRCLPLLFPGVHMVPAVESTADDTILIEGRVEDNRLMLVAQFPSNAEQYSYCLFESVVHTLISLGQSFPIPEVPNSK